MGIPWLLNRVSTSGGVATPLSRMSEKKRVLAALILFTMNAGLSLSTLMGVLPILVLTFTISSMTSGSVLLPGITSTSFIEVGGLKKCIPATFPGLGVASARSEILIFDVFVAMIALLGAAEQASFSTDFLSSNDSGTASTTRSAFETACVRSPV